MLTIRTTVPGGPYHDFWLFEEGEREYSDYRDLLPRKDAPLQIPYSVLNYFHDWFQWMTPHNPVGPDGNGFNYYGPTVFRKQDGPLLRGLCEHFLGLYQLAPEQVFFSGGIGYDIDEEGNESEGHLVRYVVDKEWILDTFSTLKSYSAKVGRGTHFLLHLGV